jgi:hypothetical protein
MDSPNNKKVLGIIFGKPLAYDSIEVKSPPVCTIRNLDSICGASESIMFGYYVLMHG